MGAGEEEEVAWAEEEQGVEGEGRERGGEEGGGLRALPGLCLIIIFGMDPARGGEQSIFPGKIFLYLFIL